MTNSESFKVHFPVKFIQYYESNSNWKSKLIEMQCMLEAVERFGRNLKPPSAYNLRTSWAEIDEIRKKHEKAWAESGCTLMSDGWMDCRRRSVINFLVNSLEGTFYLHSINALGEDS